MSERGPKLFTNKPKKANLKPVTPEMTAARSSTGAASVATPPTPTPPPKVSFARRYKFLWPLLLAVNFTVGVYLFTRTRKKDLSTEETEKPDAPTPSEVPLPTATSTATTITEDSRHPTIVEPESRPPIPDDLQRELYKWMLEEKRKVKPKDAEEKKLINEEKAILKQFLRAKSIPSL